MKLTLELTSAQVEEAVRDYIDKAGYVINGKVVFKYTDKEMGDQRDSYTIREFDGLTVGVNKK